MITGESVTGPWSPKSGPTEVTVRHIAEEFNAGYDRTVSEHSALQFSVYGAALQHTSQSDHADPCPLLKAPTVQCTLVYISLMSQLYFHICLVLSQCTGVLGAGNNHMHSFTKWPIPI